LNLNMNFSQECQELRKALKAPDLGV
jgi:hypothetical protein